MNRRVLAVGLIPLAMGAWVSGQTLPDWASRRAPSVVTSLTLFAGTGDGLWRSPDWGGSWKRVIGRPAGASLEGLGAARALWLYANQVWVAGDGGLFRSDDFGETWVALSDTAGITTLLLSRWPQADPTVFVGAGAGLLRSRDGGRTFGPTALAGTPIHRLEWPGPALVVACSRGVLISKDEGARLDGPGQGLPQGPVRALALSSYFAVDPVAFAAPAGGGVFRSDDGGTSWKPAGLAGEPVFDLVWLGPFLYAAGETGFYRTADLGATWTRLSASPGRPTRLMFPLAPAAGLEAFLATDRGVFRTGDAGEHWQAAGLSGLEVTTVATFPPPEPVGGKQR